MTQYHSKSAARQSVWDRLSEEKLAAFPFPPHGRIPNFKGSAQAATRLFEVPVFANAQKIKVNPDSSQKPVRAEALRRGITVYVPTPKLAGGFMKLDPAILDPNDIPAASTMSRCAPFAQDVGLKDLPQLDAIVCGSVAVTRAGYRAGKGEGYSDMEFAILAELGHKPVPVATTVHDVQLVGGLPQEANDLPLTYIVTPTQVVEIVSPPAPPKGIDWDRLPKDALEKMPVLEELRDFLQQEGTPHSAG